MNCPYQDLYIYYFQGRLKSDIAGLKDCIGNWEEEGFSFLFFSEPSDTAVKKLLADDLSLTLIDQYHMSYEEWQGTKLSAFRYGSFVIYPPWETPELCEGEIPIISDPGVVFGAGNHPTTRNCLYFIEKAYRYGNISTALDLGTGTGLLAIAAAKLGCEQIIAVDFNFLATKTAVKNISLNHVGDRVIAVQGMAQSFVRYPADLIVANIHYAIMKELLDTEGFFDKQYLILSGLLRSEAKDIAERLNRKKVRIIDRHEHEGIWHTFFATTE